MEENRLVNLLKNLSNKEREFLADLLSSIHKKEEINEFSIIHTPLKAESEDALKGFQEFQEINSKIAPPLDKEYKDSEKIVLPKDYLNLPFTLDRILKARASKRDYTGEALTLQELSTLLFFSYGVRRYIPAYNVLKFPFRMSPSAGGLQSIELYIVVNKVENIKKGIYHYNPFEHFIELIYEGNFRRKMVNMCITQEFIYNSSIIIILTSMMNRLLWKYKIRAYRYAHMDVGFVAENVYLVSTAMKLGACAIAGFYDDEINDLLSIDGTNEFAILLVTIGKLKRK